MKTRRFIAIMVAVLMLTGVATFIYPQAAGTLTLSFDENITAQRNETITVKVYAKNVEEVKNINFNLNFESSIFDYVEGSAKKGDDVTLEEFETGMSEEVIDDILWKCVNISVYSNQRRSSWDTDGIVATIDLKVKDTAYAKTLFSINKIAIVNTSGDKIPGVASTSTGKVFINVPIETISFSKKTERISMDEERTIEFKCTPDNYTDLIEWESSDESVATVVGGLVTPHKTGKTTIKMKSESGKSDSCEIEVYKKDTSILPEKEIFIKGAESSAETTIELNIPGPYPKKWTAYSNDSFIYVTTSKKYEVAYMVYDPNDVEEITLTILCDPDYIPKGFYTGTVTIVCGDEKETLKIEYNKTVDGNYKQDPANRCPAKDPFPTNKYRINYSLEANVEADSFVEGNRPLGVLNEEPYWEIWTSNSSAKGSPHWLTIDLKEAKTFDKIIVMMHPYGSWEIMKDFQIQASNDKNFNTFNVLKNIENNSLQFVTMDFPEVAYRYVRIWITVSTQFPETFANCGRITYFKILGKIDYPDDVEPRLKGQKDRINLKINSTSGITAFASVREGAFITNDVALNINQLGFFSDRFLTITEKMNEWMGYESDFIACDIFVENLSNKQQIQLLGEEKVEIKIAVPGGFEPKYTKALRINSDNDIESIPSEIEEIYDEEGFADISYIVFEMADFGTVVLVEDIYSIMEGGSPLTADMPIGVEYFVFLMLCAGVYIIYNLKNKFA